MPASARGAAFHQRKLAPAEGGFRNGDRPSSSCDPLGDQSATHGLVEEARGIARMRPDHDRTKIRARARCAKPAAQQCPAYAASEKSGIDIKRIHFAVKTERLVARRTEACHADDAVLVALGNQHLFAAIRA